MPSSGLERQNDITVLCVCVTTTDAWRVLCFCVNDAAPAPWHKHGNRDNSVEVSKTLFLIKPIILIKLCQAKVRNSL